MLHADKGFPKATKRGSGVGFRRGYTWPVLWCAVLLLVSCETAPEVPTEAAVPLPTPVRAPADVPLEVPPSLAALAKYHRGIVFSHLPPEAGLSQSVVVDFVQDDQGFLWLATQDGLNRYDGHEFKIFKEDPADPEGLQGNLISSLAKGPSGELWIGTNGGGLSKYDPRTGRFATYQRDPEDENSLSENAVTGVAVDAGGIVWVATANSGLNRFDPDVGQFTRYAYDPDDPESLGSDSTSSLSIDGSGAVWVGTIGGGLCRLQPGSGRFTRYQNQPSDPATLSANAIQTVYADRAGIIWVGTFAAGLNRLDPATGRVDRYAAQPADPGRLAHSSVSAIFEDSADRLWVGTNGGGLHLLDRRTHRFTRFRRNPAQSDSLSSDGIVSIFQDNSGIVWFGTFGAGADYFDPYKDKFLLVEAAMGGDGLSSLGGLWTIMEDRQGRLWLGTNEGGLIGYDRGTDTWNRYVNDPGDPESLSNNTVFAVYQDHEGRLWLGTPTAVIHFDPETEKFRTYLTPMILAILEDSAGRFWLGSGQGLMLFDRKAGSAEFLRHDPQDPDSLSGDLVSLIYEDRDGALWVGTLNAGLNRFDPESRRFTRFTRSPEDPRSLSNNTVLDIYEAADGTLWVGTGGGLNRFDREQGTFTHYRERDGLPNDYVYGILEDELGDLWLSTNKGLARFDPISDTFRVYDETDGLQDNEFNQWSHFQNDEGVMYFGGLRGLNAFHPGLVKDNAFVPPVAITGFAIYNRPVEPGPESPLRQPVEVSSEIQLSHRDGFFEFSYAALHYSAPEEIEYATIMEGLDKGWSYVGNRRYANYTNVPPGEYVFRVKATNSDGVWNEEGAALRLIIPPPFWQTLWFRALAVVAVLGSITGAFALRLRAAEAQRERLEVQVQERTRDLQETMIKLESAKEAAEAASRAKSVFLANMSHEFRTPLNAILGFTQMLIRDQRLGSRQREDLQIVFRSSEHLLALINDVLEMSKIEAGRTTLNATVFDLVHLLAGLEEMFALRAEGKGLVLKVEVAADVPPYVRGDEGKLRQILMNLLGNAVKFTQEGQVRLEVDALVVKGEQVTVRFAVHDTGPGIEADELEDLFTPFGQAAAGRQAQEGTGLGLTISQQYAHLMGGEIDLESRPGHGSIFACTVPLVASSAQELERPMPTRRVVGLQPGQPVYRMLAVDDQEVNRKLLVRLFEPLGFEIREAANGREAVKVWEEWAPHLIWMDMRMPVMDGYEATRRIKSTTRGMATIVIALTASALEEDRAVILSEGCDDYLRKPFQEDELYQAAAKHLGVRYLYEELGAEGEEAAMSAVQRAGEETSDLPPGSLAARLSVTDRGWFEELERATILGDGEAIQRLAGQIAEQHPELAEEIERLATHYEHERLLTAIYRVRDAR